jgi:hypothetical protein
VSASPDAIKSLEDALQRLERMRQQRDYWRSKAITAETKLGRKIRDAELNSGPRSLREAATDFMKKLSVGRTTKQQVGYWVERFLKDKGETKDVAEVSSDALIMRHTCGREIILKYGFEKAAAVLRHDVKTLREHYADLRTSDVSTER